VRFIIYEPVGVDAKAFVEFWADRYTGYDDDFYEANVGQELTEARILDWFEWKNGTPLSQAKRRSVMRNFVARRDELVQIEDDTPSAVLTRFSEGGVIWRIFWLHCWRPARFPIYDQHVHRAMRSLMKACVKKYRPEMPLRSAHISSSTCRFMRDSTACVTGPWTRPCGRSENSLPKTLFRTSPFGSRRLRFSK